MPALPPYIIEPIFEQFCALLPAHKARMSAPQDEHAGASEIHDGLIINYLQGLFSEVCSSLCFIAFVVILGRR